jgi:hypothetical protein
MPAIRTLANPSQQCGAETVPVQRDQPRHDKLTLVMAAPLGPAAATPAAPARAAPPARARAGTPGPAAEVPRERGAAPLRPKEVADETTLCTRSCTPLTLGSCATTATAAPEVAAAPPELSAAAPEPTANPPSWPRPPRGRFRILVSPRPRHHPNSPRHPGDSWCVFTSRANQLGSPPAQHVPMTKACPR